MTDNEIIKALECCAYHDTCDGCPMRCSCIKPNEFYKTLYNLINRQNAEVERLQKQIQEGVDLAKQIPEMLAMAQAEAIKDFAERLKELYTGEIITDDMHCSVAVIKANIDDIAKEMIGAQE